MMLVLEWILCYAAPALVGVSIAYRQPRKEWRILTIHAGILLSIILVSLVGVRLAWQFPAPYLALFVVVALASGWILGTRDALLYLISCVIQESCILLAGTLLAPVTGIMLAAGATALVFALAHRMNFANWPLRFLIIGGWAFCSILLYALLHEPLLNISLHALGGAILIYYGVLFPTRYVLEGA